MEVKQVGVIDTSKALILFQKNKQDLEEMQHKKQQQSQQGVISKKKIQNIFITTLVATTLILLNLNILIHGISIKEVLFAPIWLIGIFIEALKVGIIVLFILLTWNYYKDFKNKKQCLLQQYDKNIELHETNIATLKNMLQHSIVPVELQHPMALKTMIQWIDKGHVLNDEQAITRYLHGERRV